MSHDVAELLAEAVPNDVGAPDIERAWQAARRTKRVRTIVAGVAALVVLVFAFVAWPRSPDESRSVSIPPAQASQQDGPPSTLDSAGCTPVLAHDGTGRSPGCMLNSDQNPAVDQRLGGIPVYSDASGTTQVGLMVDVIGFVPNTVLPRLAEMKHCYPQIEASISHTPGAALSASCKALYLDAGWNESYLDGQGSPRPTESVAECVRRWEGYQRAVDPKGDPTKLSFFDHGTGGAATLTVEDYCQQVLAIEEADPSASDAGFEISNGRVVRGAPTATSSTLGQGGAAP